MERDINEETAKGIAAVIRQLLGTQTEEKSPLELVEERIIQLNRDIKQAEGNRRLQKQLLLQLKTAMKKRDELLK